ncbi:hypothetical protein OPT61_g827 [Boeremia exigua]|uniref:Uncharacterized protein n=1 Tax=Boeremia exigua TaxID=749465 RepID=A0ACC2ISJ7_9PLEO|nr:hypothetical protein OPT61_g827 [Boeremia exigua]
MRAPVTEHHNTTTDSNTIVDLQPPERHCIRSYISNLEADSSGKSRNDKLEVSGHACPAFIAIPTVNLEDDKADQ